MKEVKLGNRMKINLLPVIKLDTYSNTFNDITNYKTNVIPISVQ